MILSVFENPNFCPVKHNKRGKIMNKFAKWMKDNDKVQALVAKKLGISPSSLHEIIRLDKIPSLKIALQIEEYTNDAITVYDWLDQNLNKETKTKAKKIKEPKNQKK